VGGGRRPGAAAAARARRLRPPPLRSSADPAGPIGLLRAADGQACS
jgi:hypothetical protein